MEWLPALSTYLLLGSCAGLMGGLLGLGGGVVIVPGLIFIFRAQGMDPAVLTHMAIGTSLATIVMTASSAALEHQRRGAIDWALFKIIGLGIMVGAAFGALTAGVMAGIWLERFFAFFLLLIALKIFFNSAPMAGGAMPRRFGMASAGSFIGWLSAILGIGGGSLSVPYFIWCNISMQRAVALAAACGLPIALGASLVNLFQGFNHAMLPNGSVGFVYLPAFLGIVIASMPCAKLGANLAHRLPADALKKIFALVLAVVAILLFLR